MEMTVSFPTGLRIAITGRLASLSRAAAMEVLARRGGFFQERVTHHTDLLVIGADGWPLRRSGTITRNLRRASELQQAGCKLSIVSEAEFLSRLNDSQEADSIRRVHTVEQLSQILGISGLRIRRWIDIGLIEPTDPSSLTQTFDYQQVATARTLIRLINQGVAPRKLVTSLRRLQKWFADDHQLGMTISALEGQLLARRGIEWLDWRGQLYFSFEDTGENGTRIRFEKRSSAGSLTATGDEAAVLFDTAYRLEVEGSFEQAATVYSEWLKRFGEDGAVLFNLANVHFHLAMTELAINHYRHSVASDPACASAWNNLGLCLHELGDNSEAIEALRIAAQLEPENTETLYSLADILDVVGSDPEARLLWMRIVRLGDDSDIVGYACERLTRSGVARY